MAMRRLVATAESYVTIETFAKNLFKPNLFLDASSRPLPRRVRSRSYDVGVCVSGGPDSMALAYLLQNASFPDHLDIPAFSPHCFIVDHGAREGSKDEALQVKEDLQNLGMRATVLKIEWPAGTNPGEMDGFEAAARQARYRTIVHNALRQHCYDLFTGHHQDDQMETILLRMIRNNNTNLMGLQGMADASVVPCSHDIMDATSFLIQPDPGQEGNISAKIPIISGNFHRGMQLHRPLLPFSKQHLVRTCEHFGIPYVSDKTNLDPKHNVRNAVRYLRHHQLPRALHGSRLKAVREKATTWVENLELDAVDLLKDAVRLRLNDSCGTVEMTIMHRKVYADMLTFQYLLARIFELVSPLPFEDRQTVSSKKLASSLAQFGLSRINANSRQPVIVASKVLIQHLPTVNIGLTDHQRLLFSRQPMRQSEINLNTLHFVLDDEQIEHGDDGLYRSRFLLWDNRFWIRILASNPTIIQNVCIRVFQRADVQTKKQKEKFDQSSRKSSRDKDSNKEDFHPTPENIKFTLPVLSDDRNILAFPTLERSDGNLSYGLKWEVRYPRSARLRRILSSLPKADSVLVKDLSSEP